MLEENHTLCPKCQSDEYLVHSYALLIGLVHWHTMLIYSGIVIMTGEFFAYPPATTCAFCLLAIFPLLVRIRKKNTCLKCGIQFEEKAAPDAIVSE